MGNRAKIVKTVVDNLAGIKCVDVRATRRMQRSLRFMDRSTPCALIRTVCGIYPQIHDTYTGWEIVVTVYVMCCICIFAIHGNVSALIEATAWCFQRYLV